MPAACIPIVLDMNNTSRPKVVHIRRRSSAVSISSDQEMRRKQSLASLPSPGFPQMTRSAWKRKLADIKKDYLSKRYSRCESQCRELLDTAMAAKTTRIPIYLIHLHFYAASSLDMQVRSLARSHPHRLRLVDQARDHYQRASSLITAEDDQVSQRLAMSGYSPPESPTYSTSSADTDETIIAEPIQFMAVDYQAPARNNIAKKQVKFNVEMREEAQVFVRPDSPTLGFDEWPGQWSPELILPEPMLDKASLNKPLPPTPAERGNLPKLSRVARRDSRDSDFDNSFQNTRSLHRYGTILTGMQRQVKVHIAALDATNGTTIPPPPTNEELRVMELRTRIEKLRAQGWQRKRFDAKRYETLRENALADLMA